MSFEPNEFANYDGMTLMELIREMRRVQMAKDEAETELKKLNNTSIFCASPRCRR